MTSVLIKEGHAKAHRGNHEMTEAGIGVMQLQIERPRVVGSHLKAGSGSVWSHQFVVIITAVPENEYTIQSISQLEKAGSVSYYCPQKCCPHHTNAFLSTSLPGPIPPLGSWYWPFSSPTTKSDFSRPYSSLNSHMAQSVVFYGSFLLLY